MLPAGNAGTVRTQVCPAHPFLSHLAPSCPAGPLQSPGLQLKASESHEFLASCLQVLAAWDFLPVNTKEPLIILTFLE
jgi:hypothetical protein